LTPPPADPHIRSSMRRVQLTQTRVIFGVATLLGFFSSFQAAQLVAFVSDKPTSLWLLIGLNMGYWYTWALLAPIVLWLSRRFPFERGTWPRSVPVHIVGVFVITVAHLAMSEGVRLTLARLFWDGPMPGYSWWKQVARAYYQSFDWEMMTYWAIVIAHHAVSYYRQAQERTLKASRLETQLAEAQLQALQRQLHPHFLFNTLNAISALMHRDVEAADQMLARLSDLLRIALDQRGAQEVTLKDELEFLQKYLEIEQARFGDRLTVAFSIEPQTLDAQVPNLILQPLVENSVRHAVAVRIEPGHIEVRARRLDDVLELSVRDNGPGMPPGRLAVPGTGVGLANTRSRLERLYGAAQRLTFGEPLGGGLAVTVSIPFRADEVAEVEDFNDGIKGVA
jgi:two-component system, LytTR family, sensor kinase